MAGTWYHNCVHCDKPFTNIGFNKSKHCSDLCNFLSNFTPGNPEECWEWQGRKDRLGYGGFKDKVAHRFSYEHHIGPRTSGLVIRHLCNNPSCVNPNHLKEGTHQENSDDAKEAGTLAHLKGELNGCHKLTNPEVLEIYNSKDDYKILASRYNVDKATIQDITSGRGWNHITGAPSFVPTRKYKPHRSQQQIAIDNANKRPDGIGSNNPAAKINETIALEIYKSKGSVTNKELAARFGVSKSAISDIWAGRSWNHITKKTV